MSEGAVESRVASVGEYVLLTVDRLGRFALLAGIVASGIFLVIRNLSGSTLPANFIIFLDLCHLGLVMGFLFVSLYCLIYKKKWTTVR